MTSLFSTNYTCLDSAPVLKFIYSEKATEFCEIFTLLLSYVVPVENKMKISQNFVAFLEYTNFAIKKPYEARACPARINLNTYLNCLVSSPKQKITTV